MTQGQTDRETDRQKDRPTDKQTGRQTDRQTDREKGASTETLARYNATHTLHTEQTEANKAGANRRFYSGKARSLSAYPPTPNPSPPPSHPCPHYCVTVYLPSGVYLEPSEFGQASTFYLGKQPFGKRKRGMPLGSEREVVETEEKGEGERTEEMIIIILILFPQCFSVLDMLICSELKKCKHVQYTCMKNI